MYGGRMEAITDLTSKYQHLTKEQILDIVARQQTQISEQQTQISDQQTQISDQRKTITEQTDEMNILRSELAEALRRIFARSCERRDENGHPGQGTLFDESESESADPGKLKDEEDSSTKVEGHMRKRGKRKPLPEDLPRDQDSTYISIL